MSIGKPIRENAYVIHAVMSTKVPEPLKQHVNSQTTKGQDMIVCISVEQEL